MHVCKAGRAGRRRTVVVGSPYLVPVWYRPGRKMSLSAASEGLEGGNMSLMSIIEVQTGPFNTHIPVHLHLSGMQ